MTPAKFRHILREGTAIPAEFLAKAQACADALPDGGDKTALIEAIRDATPEPETAQSNPKDDKPA